MVLLLQRRPAWKVSGSTALSCFDLPSGRENTPGDVTEDLPNQHDLNGWRKEDQKDKGSQPEQRKDQDLAVAPFGCSPAVQQSTDNVSDGTYGVELLLPFC